MPDDYQTIQPRLFRVQLAHPLHFHLFPRDNGYLRLQVTLQNGEQRDAQVFEYEGLTVEEAIDVITATVYGQQL